MVVEQCFSTFRRKSLGYDISEDNIDNMQVPAYICLYLTQTFSN